MDIAETLVSEMADILSRSDHVKNNELHNMYLLTTQTQCPFCSDLIELKDWLTKTALEP